MSTLYHFFQITRALITLTATILLRETMTFARNVLTELGKTTHSMTVSSIYGEKVNPNTDFAQPTYNGIDYKPAYTFDHIEPWITAYYDDGYWIVSDKADDILGIPGRHIKLDSLDRGGPAVAIIHESYINMWLSRGPDKIHFNWWEGDNYDNQH